jgi:hypothetical protein
MNPKPLVTIKEAGEVVMSLQQIRRKLRKLKDILQITFSANGTEGGAVAEADSTAEMQRRQTPYILVRVNTMQYERN